MNSHSPEKKVDESNACCGPFKADSPEHLEGLDESSLGRLPANHVLAANHITANQVSVNRRRYDCQNYETCLDIAAALNWQGFSCGSCPCRVNENLLWRARQEIKKDTIAAKICELPPTAVIQKKEETPPVTPAIKAAV